MERFHCMVFSRKAIVRTRHSLLPLPFYLLIVQRKHWDCGICILCRFEFPKTTPRNVQTINLLVPERIFWESRAGFVPTDVPVCGFWGEKCRTNEKNGTYVICNLTVHISTIRYVSASVLPFIIIGLSVLITVIIIAAIGTTTYIR